MICSLVCQIWLSITRPHLFREVVVSPSKVVAFLEIVASPSSATILSHIHRINFVGLPRVPHIYPATGEELQYANTVGKILTVIPQFTSLRLGPTHWPQMTMRTRTLSRMDLDSVVMMDLSMLVQVISKLDALESLRLHVYFTRTLSGAIATALPPPLQRLKILDCDHINDHQFFIWLVSISPKPPITSLSLGAQLFPYTPAALQLIISASETLQFFKASRILSPKGAHVG